MLKSLWVAESILGGPPQPPLRTGHRLIQGGPFCFVFKAKFDHFRDLADDLQPNRARKPPGPGRSDCLLQSLEAVRNHVPGLVLR